MQMEAQERACGSSFFRTTAGGTVFLTQTAFQVYQAEACSTVPWETAKHWLLNNCLFLYLPYYPVAFTIFHKEIPKIQKTSAWDGVQDEQLNNFNGKSQKLLNKDAALKESPLSVCKAGVNKSANTDLSPLMPCCQLLCYRSVHFYDGRGLVLCYNLPCWMRPVGHFTIFLSAVCCSIGEKTCSKVVDVLLQIWKNREKRP